MPVDAGNSILYYIDALTTDWPIRLVCSCIIPIISWAIGGIDQMIISLFYLMIFDFILGFCRGWKMQRISGDKMKHGAIKFILYAATIWTAVQMQLMIRQFDPNIFGWKMGLALRDWITGYLVLNEGISCLEHLAFFGVPLPSGVIKRLKKYRNCIFTTSKD